MNRLRRIASGLLVLPLAFAGLIGSPGVAAAAVIVPPGGAGHTCSSYHYVGPDRYWQTCAWADYQYVFFTVHFGNNSNAGWSPQKITLDYIKSGADKLCVAARWSYPNNPFVIPAHSVRGTDRLKCVLTRVSAAYAANANVEENFGLYDVVVHSPTLQVQ